MKLTINFISDWHVGEGAGAKGHVDRVIRRHPSDGLPYVPAKTLTGILRDGCETVARALDCDDEVAGRNQTDSGPWHEFVNTLFGRQSNDPTNPQTTTPARLTVREARYSEGLRRVFAADDALKAALTFIKAGVKLDEHGVAEEKMLRYEEMVVGGSVLEAELSLDVDLTDDQRQDALAILTAGCRWVDRLGAKRRRGHGRCELTLSSADQSGDAWIKRLEHGPHALEPVSRLAHLPVADIAIAPPAIDHSTWTCLRLGLETVTPVVIPDATAGNVITTKRYVPGSMLLSALQASLRRVLTPDAVKALPSLIAQGRILVRNGYIADKLVRCLPVPLALFQEKAEKHNIVNQLDQAFKDDYIQRKQCREVFANPAGLLPISDADGAFVETKLYTATHATISDEEQRPNETVGGVFTYEALAPQQSFVTEILIQGGLVTAGAKGLLVGLEIQIGRSKKDDYGRMRVVSVEQTDRTLNGAGFTPIPAGKEFNVWLTSPVLLRDAALRPSTEVDLLVTELGKALGDSALKLANGNNNPSHYLRAVREEGWLNAWAEPRVTRFGIAGGTCLRLRAANPISAELQHKLAIEGLGERRAEGYGEVMVTPALLAVLYPQRVTEAKEKGDLPTSKPVDLAGLLGAEEHAFAKQLLRRAGLATIRHNTVTQAEAWTNELGFKTTPSSQLGNLRSVVEHWDGQNLTPLQAWVQQIRDVEDRKSKWPAKFLDRLNDLASAPNDGKKPHPIWIFPFESGKTSAESDSHRRTLGVGLPEVAGLDYTLLNDDQFAREALRIALLGIIGHLMDKIVAADKAKQSAQEVSHVA